MARIAFNGMVVQDRLLYNVQPRLHDDNTWKAVALDGTEDIVLKGGFANEADCRDYINKVANKMIAEGVDDIIDVRTV